MRDCNYFKNSYKVIAEDLSKQQALDADPKVVWNINFTGNIDRPANATMFYTVGETGTNSIFCFNIKWLNISL